MHEGKNKVKIVLGIIVSGILLAQDAPVLPPEIVNAHDALMERNEKLYAEFREQFGKEQDAIDAKQKALNEEQNALNEKVKAALGKKSDAIQAEAKPLALKAQAVCRAKSGFDLIEEKGATSGKLYWRCIALKSESPALPTPDRSHKN